MILYSFDLYSREQETPKRAAPVRGELYDMTSDDVLFIHIRRRRNNMKRNFTLPSQTSINYFLLVLVQIFLSFQKKCIPFVILSRTARINMVMNGSNTPSNADVFDLNTQVFSPDENSRAGRDGYR